MRQIIKGDAPDILTGEGAWFQDAALRYAARAPFADADQKKQFADALHKNAEWVPSGGGGPSSFGHYASALFAKFSYYSDTRVKRRLIATHHGKCAFCESFIMPTDVGDVEHYRPKSEVTVADPDDPDHELSVEDHPGYFWLSATWDNLFLSCKQCNQACKRNFFEVFPFSPRKTPAALDAAENALLLNPSIDDADLRRLIRFNPDTAEAMLDPGAMFAPVAPDALPYIARTIGIVGLNRPRLIEARANHLLRLRALFVTVANDCAWAHPAEPSNLDTVPAILGCSVRDSSAASDAQEALRRAIDSTAEYSALAQDALIVWSALMRFAPIPADVALGGGNQLRLQTEHQRLSFHLELAEACRRRNAESSEAEAVPDTSDIDEDYNELLRRYKETVTTIGSKASDLGRTIATIRQLRDDHRSLCDSSGVTDIEDRWNLAKGERQALLKQGGFDSDHAPQPRFGEILALITGIEAEMNTDPMRQRIAESDARIAHIGDMEETIEAHWSSLCDIRAELVDVHESYRIRGASRASRLGRCEQLRDALDAVMNWLDSGADLAAEYTQHFQNKGFPPSIRK